MQGETLPVGARVIFQSGLPGIRKTVYGTVAGRTRDPDMVKVRLDGYKTASNWPRSYWRLASKQRDAQLKPCPFCGGHAAIVYGEDDDFHVACEDIDCYAAMGLVEGITSGSVSVFGSIDAAAEAWNRRTPSSETEGQDRAPDTGDETP